MLHKPFDFFRLGTAARAVVEPGTGGAIPASDSVSTPTERSPGAQAPLSMGGELAAFPPAESWDDWVEYDPKAWPRKVERHYMLVPTTCFNCEAGCGLL